MCAVNYRYVLWITDVSSGLHVCAADYRCLMQIMDMCCGLQMSAADYRDAVDYRWIL